MQYQFFNINFVYCNPLLLPLGILIIAIMQWKSKWIPIIWLKSISNSIGFFIFIVEENGFDWILSKDELSKKYITAKIPKHQIYNCFKKLKEWINKSTTLALIDSLHWIKNNMPNNPLFINNQIPFNNQWKHLSINDIKEIIPYDFFGKKEFVEFYSVANGGNFVNGAFIYRDSFYCNLL